MNLKMNLKKTWTAIHSVTMAQRKAVARLSTIDWEKRFIKLNRRLARQISQTWKTRENWGSVSGSRKICGRAFRSGQPGLVCTQKGGASSNTQLLPPESSEWSVLSFSSVRRFMKSHSSVNRFHFRPRLSNTYQTKSCQKATQRSNRCLRSTAKECRFTATQANVRSNFVRILTSTTRLMQTLWGKHSFTKRHAMKRSMITYSKWRLNAQLSMLMTQLHIQS